MTNDDPTPAHQHHQHAEDDHEHEFEPLEYVDAVEAFRAEKDHYFRHGEGSPLPPGSREEFAGLPYFPVDPDLRFEGLTLEPYAGSEQRSFMIPTSDDRVRPADRIGSLHFEIGDQPRTLAAYAIASAHEHEHEHHEHAHEDDVADEELEPAPTLFVPFLDQTSGRETYGAGRYLDIEPEDDGTYSLDFNLAYNPSCAYDVRFSCPLTPAENRLDVRIEAGERWSGDEAH